MLQRAACVRAFLGAPSLIVVENLADGLADGLLAPLINAMRVARDRDAAVLWFARMPTSTRTRPAGNRGACAWRATRVPLEGVG